MALLSQNKSKGFYIIEVIISSTIGLLIFTALASLIFYTIKTSRVNKSELKATMYLQEMIEVAKDLEQSEEGWAIINISTCDSIDPEFYYPKINSDKWELVGTDGNEDILPEEDKDIYDRSLKIENVERNMDESSIDYYKIIGTNCASTNPNNDPNTKKVVATISWNDGFRDRDLKLETYVYNYTE